MALKLTGHAMVNDCGSLLPRILGRQAKTRWLPAAIGDMFVGLLASRSGSSNQLQAANPRFHPTFLDLLQTFCKITLLIPCNFELAASSPSSRAATVKRESRLLHVNARRMWIMGSCTPQKPHTNDPNLCGIHACLSATKTRLS